MKILRPPRLQPPPRPTPASRIVLSPSPAQSSPSATAKGTCRASLIERFGAGHRVLDQTIGRTFLLQQRNRISRRRPARLELVVEDDAIVAHCVAEVHG